MCLWIFILLSVPYTNAADGLRETEYECGSHGRFEYCIDGIPGCVVGCHCHPGYYFDTDTKICEPNIKLTQHFRRNNYEIPEPTRVYIAQTTKPSPPKTAVDEKIDLITQDADDLGDWLYNQFFKTIENQVINETKDDTVLTRRSGNAPSADHIVKPTRRAHKYWRSKKKKKRNTKKGLRSKLLRITEDDSLFDSGSSSESDDSSDSSASVSRSREKSREYKVSNSDHGHKKIVVYNKRPKMPLPSFIFLPNMDTPFFPPIGLPPPPMPMYPMVPVPPMMGPYPFPVPGTAATTAAETTSAATTVATASSADTGAPTEPATTPEANEPEENTPEEKEAEPEPNEEPAPPEGEPEAPTDNTLRLRGKKIRKSRPRNKLVQKLRDKLKRKNKLQNYFAQNYQNPEMQMVPPPNMEPPDDFQMPMMFQPRQKATPDVRAEDEFPGLQDIDFKYLSQLIHRADLNRTSPSPQPPLMMDPPSTPIRDMMLPVPTPSRRNYGGYPDQMTQALSKLENLNLANHPMNLNPDNQPLYQSLKQNYNSNQQPYNNPNQFIGNQPTYKPPNQVSLGTTNQQAYKQPTILNQQVNNAPNPQAYNTLNNPSFNLFNQPKYNGPDKSAYTQPIIPYQPSLNTPNKPIYNLPVQQNFQPNQPPQQLQNAPRQQPPGDLNQAHYNDPNRRTYIAPNQPEYNSMNQLGLNVNQPTYVSLNKPLQNFPHRKKIEDTNDTYYSSLGRQIASMIRNIDGNKDVDIEIKANVPNDPIITDNGGSRSYWERYVRSPYKMIDSYRKEVNHLKNSNENLFSLENKVSLAALREPIMSLNELENLISQMQQTKAKSRKIDNLRHRQHKSAKTATTNVNVKLQPEDDVRYLNRLGHSDDDKLDWLLPAQSSPNKPFQPAADFKMLLYLKSNISTNVRDSKNAPRPLTRDNGLGLLTNFMFPKQSPKVILNETFPNTRPKIIPTRKPTNKPPQAMYKMSNPHFKAYSYTVLPIPMNPAILRHKGYEPAAYMQATTKRTLYQQKMHPMVIYDGGNHNQYLFEKTSIPVQQKPYARVEAIDPYATYGSRIEPSYFHHEVHHFDYFDDNP